METLIYNNYNIEITTNGTSKFMYADHDENLYNEYDYTDIEYFINDIDYLPENKAIEILSVLDDYYIDDIVYGTITFECSVNKKAWHQLLRDCNNLANEYSIKYTSELN